MTAEPGLDLALVCIRAYRFQAMPPLDLVGRTMSTF
jgi:hypothetical protein